ncbi:transposase [Nitrosomonas sp.]|uniref:IS66 family transposase n=1 Tax=Nitrosomonas sp. TaxID=42353 RepID=UPI002611F8FC|nr:transposase [Nitrosomonas sp.]
MPYQRALEYFQDQIGLPISLGLIYNFNQQAFALLDQLERKLTHRLLVSPLLHADETGINTNGKLQCAKKPTPILPYDFYEPYSILLLRNIKRVAVMRYFAEKSRDVSYPTRTRWYRVDRRQTVIKPHRLAPWYLNPHGGNG